MGYTAPYIITEPQETIPDDEHFLLPICFTKPRFMDFFNALVRGTWSEYNYGVGDATIDTLRALAYINSPYTVAELCNITLDETPPPDLIVYGGFNECPFQWDGSNWVIDIDCEADMAIIINQHGCGCGCGCSGSGSGPGGRVDSPDIYSSGGFGGNVAQYGGSSGGYSDIISLCQFLTTGLPIIRDDVDDMLEKLQLGTLLQNIVDEISPEVGELVRQVGPIANAIQAIINTDDWLNAWRRRLVENMDDPVSKIPNRAMMRGLAQYTPLSIDWAAAKIAVNLWSILPFKASLVSQFEAATFTCSDQVNAFFAEINRTPWAGAVGPGAGPAAPVLIPNSNYQIEWFDIDIATAAQNSQAVMQNPGLFYGIILEYEILTEPVAANLQVTDGVTPSNAITISSSFSAVGEHKLAEIINTIVQADFEEVYTADQVTLTGAPAANYTWGDPDITELIMAVSNSVNNTAQVNVQRIGLLREQA